MRGKKRFLDKEVTRFPLSERGRPHKLCPRLAESVDWSFLYDATRVLYSHTGQPSLDPVVFFKPVLVGRLENLVSDRRLVEHGARRLVIPRLLGYAVDEVLPWHSTISRTRPLFPAAGFERLFDHVFAQCVNQGLVAGDTQALPWIRRPSKPTHRSKPSTLRRGYRFLVSTRPKSRALPTTPLTAGPGSASTAAGASACEGSG